MAISIRRRRTRRKVNLKRPRSPYTSSHPRPVKISYMEGYGPNGKLENDG